MAAQIVKWDDFVQRVRRYRSSDLLAATAATNVAIAPDARWDRKRTGGFYPWALAAIARESIRTGNEYRRPGVTERDLAVLCAHYANLYDPLIDNRDALAALTRIAYEQFPFQESPYFGAVRSRLLFEQPSSTVASQLQIVSPTFWASILGHPLDVLLNTGLLLGAGAMNNGGVFDLGWFQQPVSPQFAPIASRLPGTVVQDLLSTTFAADITTFKGMCAGSYQHGYERVSFNPLQARPFISQGGGRYLAPMPQLALWRASAPSLYYIALEKLNSPSDKKAFTEDVGVLFEDYVVRQSSQLPLVRLEREITYQRGSQTTDAILVWPDFTLLVEVKATRLTQEARMGGATLRSELDRTISHAFKQLDNTAELIRAAHPALAHIDASKPIYGLVVTLEPYHVVDQPFARSQLSFNSQSIPVAVASVQDFERFVADTLAQPLSATDMAGLVQGDPTIWDFDGLGVRRSAAGHRNPMLDAEFNKVVAFGIQVPSIP